MNKRILLALYKIVHADKDNLDFSSFQSVKEWVKHNVNDVYSDDEDENSDPHDEIADNRINAYISKYNSIIQKPFIEIYRLIVLEDISQMNLKDIGIHWSFEIDGVGDYGVNRPKTKKDKNYILTGTVNPKDIAWEYGLTSFMYYGEDQWECAIEPKSKIKITGIDGLTEKEKAKIKFPIIATVGNR